MAQTIYLNVDLEVTSDRPLGRLVTAMEHLESMPVSNFKSHGLHCVAFEVAVVTQSADRVVRSLVRRVERLPPDARRLFDESFTRDFNIGFQAGTEQPSYATAIGVETLSMIAALGCRLTLTIYPAEPNPGDRAHAKPA